MTYFIRYKDNKSGIITLSIIGIMISIIVTGQITEKKILYISLLKLACCVAVK
ncbi:hypothetical protein SAMN05216273_101169 [Chryseobacterium taihuense]|uniref:Uncharacterized protein n=1 Tax=Chryseobacterium taihuense TaxID=1141221 RepID=A0ABY0QPH0_9FLAO|nr:hypothetical protein SAMN05216273_101169 [Chryseobacterium taihuense]